MTVPVPDLGLAAPCRAAAGVRVKICGLTSPQMVEAAVGAGAAYVGFVFFPPSPRSLAPAAAREAALAATPGVVKVGLFVDPDDALLDTVIETV
ncbi:MAG: hypothetical protein AAF698_10375, partial [Pseudomonadota bacterium]